MTLKTSLIITGDSSVAKKAVDDLNASIAGLGDKAKATAAPIAEVDKAQTGAAASAKEAATATGGLGQAQEQVIGRWRRMTPAIDAATAAQTGGATAARDATTAQQGYGQALAQTAAQSGGVVAANENIAASTAAAGKQLADVEAAQKGAAGGAIAHAAAAAGLDGEIKTMIAQIAGGASVFDTMATRGGAFAKALAEVAKASSGAKVDIEGTGASSEKAGVDLGGLGDTVLDVGGKVEGMGGKLGAVGAVLGGPWGFAIGLGIDAVGGMAQGLIEWALSSDKVTDSSLELVDALDKQKFATDAAREAIRDYNDQQDRSRKNNEAAHRESLQKVQDDIAEAISTRQKTKAHINDLRARQQDPNLAVGSFPGAGANFTVGTDRAALEAQLKAQDKAIADLQQTLRNELIVVGKSKGEAAVDPMKAINLKYDLQRQNADNAAAANTKLAQSIDKTVAAIERRRAAALKEEEERQRRAAAKPKTVSLGNQVEVGSAASILATAERYRGLSENNAADRDRLRDLFRQGQLGSVDPAITAWCAAFVNSVLAATGKGNGSLSARSFLGYGSATDTPNKGDIVVSKRGGDGAQGHVGFYQGTDAKGRVLVLGGNTGDRVATQAVDRDDVLGFRRAPTASAAYRDSQKGALDAQKAASDAAKQQARDLDQVIAKYLPATAAAKEYADELARIATLAASYDGKNAASGLTAEQADAARAALKVAHDKRLAAIELTPEAKAADEAKRSIDGLIVSLQQEAAVRAAASPAEAAMIEHREQLAALARVDPAAAAEREAALRNAYAQADAMRTVEDATRAAADAQRYLRDMAFDAFQSIVLGGEKAGKVLDRMAKQIASAALEAAMMGTGPLAALFSGTAAVPAAAGGSASATLATVDAFGKSVGRSVGDRLAGLLGGGGSSGAAGGKLGSLVGAASQAVPYAALAYAASSMISDALGLKKTAGGLFGVGGNLLGTIFAGSKTASASIAAEHGAFVASKGTGSTGALASQAGGAAGTVAAGLQQIAEQLGGAIGSISGISIGTKNGKWHVNSVGGQIGKKGSGDIGFGKDGEAEAVAYAMQQAIAKGAVTGLSAAVQQAIKSSSDLDKALAEALKVQDLELLVGGVNAQIDKAFRDFETQAKERVRLATTYGFDVVEIEKRNGEDRVKLAEKLAADQVGSLQKLIEELTQGSLFEGSAMERIDALNTAIAKAKADLDAGVEGAGDTLADLYAKRLAASKDAYGSTSGYAADRTATLDAARAAVAQANARIAAAQTAKISDPALATTNAALDENNDQNAQILAALKDGNGLLASFAAAGGLSSGFDLRKLAGINL